MMLLSVLMIVTVKLEFASLTALGARSGRKKRQVPKGYSKSNIAKELLQSDIGGLVGLSDGKPPLTTNAWLLRRRR